jgi:hypothetical protein
MKNLKVLLFALLLSTSVVFANNFVPDIPVKEIRSQVADLFTTPEFKVTEDIVVNITFTFSTDGDIIVLSVDSKDPEILKYVRNNLNHKYIDTPGEPNRIFSLPLKITK